MVSRISSIYSMYSVEVPGEILRLNIAILLILKQKKIVSINSPVNLPDQLE